MHIPRDAWYFASVLLAFKLILTVVIFLHMPTPESLTLLVAQSTPFFLFLAAALLPIIVFWFRMLRGRAKRRRLLRGEFSVD